MYQQQGRPDAAVATDFEDFNAKQFEKFWERAVCCGNNLHPFPCRCQWHTQSTVSKHIYKTLPAHWLTSGCNWHAKFCASSLLALASRPAVSFQAEPEFAIHPNIQNDYKAIPPKARLRSHQISPNTKFTPSLWNAKFLHVHLLCLSLSVCLSVCLPFKTYSLQFLS